MTNTLSFQIKLNRNSSLHSQLTNIYRLRSSSSKTLFFTVKYQLTPEPFINVYTPSLFNATSIFKIFNVGSRGRRAQLLCADIMQQSSPPSSHKSTGQVGTSNTIYVITYGTLHKKSSQKALSDCLVSGMALQKCPFAMI